MGRIKALGQISVCGCPDSEDRNLPLQAALSCGQKQDRVIMTVGTFTVLRTFTGIKSFRPMIRFAFVIVMLKTQAMTVNMKAAFFDTIGIDLYHFMNMRNVLVVD